MWLGFLSLTINVTCQSTIGFSPFEIIFGTIIKIQGLYRNEEIKLSEVVSKAEDQAQKAVTRMRNFE